MKWGILFRWQSFWIGAHWSPYNRRLCVNLIPFFTMWVTARDGITPDKGTNVYRNDMDERIKKAVAAEYERRFCRTQKRISNIQAAARLLRNLSSEQLEALHHATQRAIKEEISFEEYKVIVDQIHAEEPATPDSPQYQRNEAMAFFERSKREAHERMFAFERTLNLTDRPESGEASSAAAVAPSPQQHPASAARETEHRWTCFCRQPYLLRVRVWLSNQLRRLLHRAEGS